MSITVCPVTPEFVAKIGDVDLAQLANSDLAAIKEAFYPFHGTKRQR